MDDKIKVATKVNKRLWKRLKRVAKLNGMKITHLIETGIETVLKEYEQKDI